MANFSFSSSPPFLLLFTFSFLFVVSSGQGLEAFNTSCPNPEGVVAPDVVEIGVLVTPQGASIDSSVFLVALDLINEDRCLLPGILFFVFVCFFEIFFLFISFSLCFSFCFLFVLLLVHTIFVYQTHV